ncbi:uncharacterized protein LOC131951910 [Physella acuta]|uniref:uncharacterized protein LOC131951910 n=1 Tax=Physella acuta TaxID=109671 RepID=UPI0027DD1699|nr:uncharacterized protein LOC131951910 [Physella acuta]
MFFYVVFALGFIACTDCSDYRVLRQQKIDTCDASTIVTTTSPPQPCYLSGNTSVIETGCWGYKICKDNVTVLCTCPEHQVLERAIMACVVPENSASHECSNATTCENKEDGMYGVVADNCHTYTRCLDKKPIGEFYCPATTVFNNEIQSCDFSINVLPPCGTKPVVG